jgi:hypothetical protein
MGFPFITKPFEGWVQDELNNRTKKKLTHLNRFTPFIWISSGAIVCKGAKKPDDIEQTLSAAKYKGCVISNTIDNTIKYPTKKTYLGYDLTGELIEVENDSKRVSPPIIESMEIDTDGENNTLKIANINITIFSLKQLEMFELFFLKPSMTVVMEYGHINPDTKIKVASESFINKKNWDSYITAVKDNFIPNAETYQEKRKKYLEKLEKTKGDYDFWIGKVTNFNVQYEGADGVYKVQLTVSSGNELHLWKPFKQQSVTDQGKNTTSSQTNVPNEKPGPNTWMRELLGELVLPETTVQKFVSPPPKDPKKPAPSSYADEFFNWDVTSDKTNTENASKEKYISFKLILDIMNNVELYKQADEKISTKHFQIGGKDSIPVNSSKNIISTNPNFIIPGKLPKIVVNSTKREVDIDKTPLDYPINGKSFNYEKVDIIETKYGAGNFELAKDGTYGNLLNIFVNKNLFVKLFKDSYTFVDFYSSILTMINDLLFGLCKLEIGKFDDTQVTGMTIIDKKIYKPAKDNEVKEIYRFTTDPLKSIMHDMSFNLEMSNLMQAQALYESQLAINKKRTDNNNQEVGGTAYRTERHHWKTLGQSNIDNMYSVDWVGYQVILGSDKWQPVEPGKDETKNDKSENTEANFQKELNGIISGKSIKFRLKDKTPVPLIYQDYTFIQSRIITSVKSSSVLTYLECDITIDGLAGFRCGELFKVDGVPEIYNKNGAFQILNIKQSVQNDTGWRTTINAAFRYNDKN